MMEQLPVKSRLLMLKDTLGATTTQKMLHETETDCPNVPGELHNVAAPTEVETEQPPVEIEVALSPSEQQTDKTMTEPASVMGATTTTAPICHSQRIENNEREGIVTTAPECEWYIYENRDGIPINGKVQKKGEFIFTVEIFCIKVQIYKTGTLHWITF